MEKGDTTTTAKEQAETYLGIVPNDVNHERKIEYLAYLFEKYAKEKAWEMWKEARKKYAVNKLFASEEAIKFTFEKAWEENNE